MIFSRNNKEGLVTITSGICTADRQEKGLYDWAKKWSKNKFIAGLWKSDNNSKEKETMGTQLQKWKHKAITNDDTTNQITKCRHWLWKVPKQTSVVHDNISLSSLRLKAGTNLI